MAQHSTAGDVPGTMLVKSEPVGTLPLIVRQGCPEPPLTIGSLIQPGKPDVSDTPCLDRRQQIVSHAPALEVSIPESLVVDALASTILP